MLLYLYSFNQNPLYLLVEKLRGLPSRVIYLVTKSQAYQERFLHLTLKLDFPQDKHSFKKSSFQSLKEIANKTQFETCWDTRRTWNKESRKKNPYLCQLLSASVLVSTQKPFFSTQYSHCKSAKNFKLSGGKKFHQCVKNTYDAFCGLWNLQPCVVLQLPWGNVCNSRWSLFRLERRQK